MKTIFDTIWEPEDSGNDSEQNSDPINAVGSECVGVYMCCGGGGGGGGGGDTGYAGGVYMGGCVPHI